MDDLQAVSAQPESNGPKTRALWRGLGLEKMRSSDLVKTRARFTASPPSPSPRPSFSDSPSDSYSDNKYVLLLCRQMPLKRGPRFTFDTKTAIALYEKHSSLQKVAELLGVTKQAVALRFKNAGVKVHPPGGREDPDSPPPCVRSLEWRRKKKAEQDCMNE